MLVTSRSCSFFFFFKQKTAYEMRISDWSSDVCSSDLGTVGKEWVDRFYGLYESVLGKHPVVRTEAGYFTGSAAGTGANPVTEAQQAEYLPKHVRLYTEIGRASCRERVCQYV